MKTPPTPRSGRTAVAALAPVHHAPNAALLIDFDNVTLGIRSDLTKELRSLLGSEIIKGKVAVQRAYADWRRYPQYIVPLSESSIDLIFAPAFGTNKKNATDIRLAVDAIELVFTRPEIGTIILLSGDSDFSSLVLKLKEYGKYVIGVGIRESASDILIQNCDEYYSYSDLAGLTREAEGPSVQRDPWELVVEAAQRMAQSGDVMRSDRLKQVMQQIDPNFDESNAGFSRFSKFVTAAGDRGLITVTKLDNGQFEVAPVTGAVAKASAAPAAQAARAEGGEDGARRGRRRGRGRGRGREREREEQAETPELEVEAPPAEPRSRGGLTLAEAFQLLQQALGEMRAPVAHEALRARMVALLGREDALLAADRFPKLLRQANDAEIADVRKLTDDKFEVSPHRTQALASAAAKAARGTVTPEPAAGQGAAPEAETEGERRPAAVSRFRRGSRAPARPAEVALVGAVRIGGPPAEPAPAVPPAKGRKGAKPKPAASAEPVAAPAAPKGRGKKTKAASAAPAAPAAEAPAKAGGRSRRGRGRAKSKA